MNKRMSKADRLAARWSPINGQRTDYPDYDAVVWKYEHNGKAAACVYTGSAMRPTWNSIFPTPERRDSYLADWLSVMQRAQAQRLQIAAQFNQQCAEFFAALSVGVIFSTTGGYEQTNAQFYQVVGEVKANRAVVRRITHTAVESPPHSMSGYALPCQDMFDGDMVLFKITGAIPDIWKEGNKVRISWYG